MRAHELGGIGMSWERSGTIVQNPATSTGTGLDAAKLDVYHLPPPP
ncbi:MAG TPA: hypothetical protein VH877_11160 [Polyangia bacterium]|nr:hypothetical protein [Polyangia bacterium]